MDSFFVYFKLGVSHITAFNGFDHILFIIVLMATFRFADWRKIVWVITAFTIGHSLTLLAAALNIFTINGDLVEILIPFTIFITALANVTFRNKRRSPANKFTYTFFLAIFFGLIHGLGFSNFFGSLVGKDASVILPLLSFNVGIEIGQVIVVALVLLTQAVTEQLLRFKGPEWNTFASGAGIGLSLKIILDNVLV